MSDRYPGGLIRKTPPTITPPTGGEGGSASGIWTMDQVAYYIKEGTWPKGFLPRELYTWGQSGYGALGNNTNNPDRTTPGTTVASNTDWESVTSGSFCQAAIAGGKLFTWGYGGLGSLGHNNTVYRSSPTQVGALTNWSKVSMGQSYGTHAVKTDGTLWAWGSGTGGQLGINSTVTYSSPVQVGALTDWANVHGGVDQAAAIKTDGTIWSWGNAQFGGTGQNTTTNTSSPVQIGASTDWLDLECGTIYSSYAVKTDGTAWSWGWGASGKLMQNSLTNFSSPVQIGALTNWQSIVSTRSAAFGLKTDNTLWVAGGNSYGELGLNLPAGTTFRSSPVQLGAADWSILATDAYNTMFVIKTDGTLWGWGDAVNGMLGAGSTIDKSSPVQIGSETTWASVACGNPQSIGILKVVS